MRPGRGICARSSTSTPSNHIWWLTTIDTSMICLEVSEVSDDRVQDALARLAADQEGSLPGLLGFLWTHASRGEISGASRWRSSTWRRLAFFTPRPSWPSPTRRAATAVCNPCPKGATGFATAELNANFIGTAREGGVTCNARLVHGGRTTQLWDAEVKGRALRQDDRIVSLHADPALPRPRP